jgi:general secretion pathway protein L
MTATAQASFLATTQRFIDWWTSELSELISLSDRQGRWDIMFLRREAGCDAFVRSRDLIEQVASPQTGSDTLVAELRQRFGRRNRARPHVILRLQPREVVQSRIDVPAAARDVMEPVLRHQIERLAPWPADKALLAYEIAGPAAQPGMLDVRVTITGRQRVETLVGELDSLGYRPNVVDFGTEVETDPRVNLLPRQPEDERAAGRLVLKIVGAACALALIVSSVGLFGVVQNARELSELGIKLEQLRAQSKLDRDAKSFKRGQERQSLLAAEKLTQPSAVIVLEALSRALPDDAWLERLEIGQGSVRLVGNAANAAVIIGRIEASGHFADVQFAAPTTRTEAENYESFTITAQIMPGKELEP